MKKNLRMVVYLLLFCSPLAASVRIIESSASRLVFRWELGTFDTASLRFSGANIILGSVGEPAIPGFSVYAGVPASGSVRVHFAPGTFRTITLNHPLKNNVIEGKGIFPMPQDVQFPDGWLSVPRYTWLKNMRATQLIIRPFQYDANTRAVRVLASGECTVEFPAPAPLSGARPAETDYQRMLKGLVLNYDVACQWMKPLRQQKALRKAADQFPFQYNQPLCTFTIGDGHAGTNAYTIKENGIVKIDGLQLKKLFASLLSTVDTAAIPLRSVALYASWKGALSMICPAMDSIPAGVSEVPLFRCDRNGNNRVDNDDYFLAYVSGLSDWHYDPMNYNYSYVLDNYDDNRHYWLTIKPPGAGNGATITRFLEPAGIADTVDYSINHVMFGEMKYQPIELDGRGIPISADVVGYVWERLFSYNTTFNYPLDLPSLDNTVGGTLRFSKYPNTYAQVMMSVSGNTICTDCQAEADYPVTNWGNGLLRIEYTDDPNSHSYWQLQNIRADYRQRLYANADSPVCMNVFPSSDTGIKSYRLSLTGNSQVYIFRIPRDESSVALIDTITGGTQHVWSDSGNTGTRYLLCNAAGFITLPDTAFSPPPQRQSSLYYVISNLRDTNNSADYLIVTHPEFLSEAERLAAHKASHGFFRPRVVVINDIYTDFAGGNLDPVALRNFLAFAARNWRSRDTLVYVVFMGTGHYDFKQIKTTEKNFIPPAELEGNTCIEDFYAALSPGRFGGSGELSLALGRLPCQTSGEASLMVDKITAVEDVDVYTADWGSWRNTMLFVADDDMQSGRCDPICSPNNTSGHHVSSERTADSAVAHRPSLDVRKVYLFDYPWTSSYEKPEASRAIANEINSGVGYANYYGHGSDAYWADEHVLSEKVVPLLYNENRYPFISSFSCGVSTFDKPGISSLSELLMKASRAGAVATFASTRGAMPGPNEVLGINLYKALFSAESPTFGTAILDAKLNSGGVWNGNNNVYALFGDPSLRLMVLSRRVELNLYDMVNDTLLQNQLQALQQIRIKGTIVKVNGQTDNTFGDTAAAFVQLAIFNPPEITGRKDGGTCDMVDGKNTVQWLRPGKPIFSARTTVRNGSFEQTAIIPPNITFDVKGAKLIAYAWEGQKVGVGCLDSLFFHGTCASCSPTNDTVGPRITIRPIYDLESMRSSSVSFSDRVVSSLPLKCEIELYDESGINVIDNGPDQGLNMEIPGIFNRRNINYKFQFAEGDYRKGSALLSFEENSLKTGSYNLNVSAQDLPGNVSQKKFVLEITDKMAFSLNHVFNTPNPMRMGGSTRFFFYPSTTTTQNVAPPLDYIIVIKIYSLGGRLLKVIKNAYNGQTWNGSDQTGYPLPPNIYLYQVTADYPSQDQGKLTKSKIQKLVIHPPK